MEDQESNKRMKINEHAKDTPSDNSRNDIPNPDGNAATTDKKVYPRKVSSMFASNRAIHQLTENIVRNSEQTNEAHGNTDTLHTAQSSSHEVTPARKESDDELQITSSNVINAMIDYAHPRFMCGKFPHEDDPLKYCPNCYCKPCDILASKCTNWSVHCHAVDTPKNSQQKETTDDDDDVIHIDSDSNPSEHSQDDYDQEILDDYEMMHRYDHHFDQGDKDQIGNKNRRDCRITEVLAHNLKQLSNLSIAKQSTASRSGNNKSVQKMEGDIPQLNLHNAFFVEGVKIGWPYPAIMPPQRQMAIHLIKAFKNKRHVVIESPTGTGKSAAILCSALAWQRYDKKTNEFGETTKIIYCSRTHSQVGQMVQSLKKTPYRPRMAILGSRDRLCIHKDLRPRNNVHQGNGQFDNRRNTSRNNRNLNQQCQIRVGNTEGFRKYAHKSLNMEYDDDRPPAAHPGDETTNDQQQNQGGEEDDAQDEEGTSTRMNNAKTKMCPHYRQLTSMNLAEKVQATMVPHNKRVNCCSMGGDKTKLGAHDIEDLVQFGMQPNIKRGVALYREPHVASFGLKLKQPGQKSTVFVHGVTPESAADKEGTIQADDALVTMNKLNIAGGYELKDISNRIRQSQDPLLLDVYRGDSSEDIDIDEYASEAACPYYLSRALAKSAELVFCPYNYILDPNIREAMDIDINNSVIVLDEAHNVEDTLRSEGSGQYGLIEILEMNAFLSNWAAKWNPSTERFDAAREQDMEKKAPEVAHEILVFLDKIIEEMHLIKENFENDRGKKGVTAVTAEYEKFNCADDKEFEVQYFGPTGSGDGKKPIGCEGFFSNLDIDKNEVDRVRSKMTDFYEHMSSKRGGADETSQKRNIIMDRLNHLVMTLCAAFDLSEHYYISNAISANGNLDYATGGGNPNARFKRKPKPNPQNPSTTLTDPRPRTRICIHPSCNKSSKGTITHDLYCNGETPRWDCHLIINLLTPAVLMAPLLENCRSVVLASGSLAPIPSLCSELHLLPPAQSTNRGADSSKSTPQDDKKDEGRIGALSSTSGRLQVTPKPLEANHVVTLQKQLLALSIGHFPDGSTLSATYANYSKPGFYDKLGSAISTLIESIPKGGVLVFFPSFTFLRKCVSTWQNSSTWNRLVTSKGEVVVEPSSSQAEFEEARDTFNGTIERTGKCILLAVFRGKMSEGVSFNDDYARGVICVGLPYPSSFDRAISAKKDYNNEQRRYRKKDLLSGGEWYSQQAYRAIAQAIGRCIRHAGDYGTIILLDNRHCDDGHSYNHQGICRAHMNLPKWMRTSVRTLRKDQRQIGRKDLLGGWRNLRHEMNQFFHGAAIHSASVLQKQKEDFERKKQANMSNPNELQFDHKNGSWSSSQMSQPRV